MPSNKPPKITTQDMYIAFCETPPKPAPVGPMYDKVRSCMNKIDFLTMEAAQKCADQQKDPFDAYKCRWCSFYHIGHRK